MSTRVWLQLSVALVSFHTVKAMSKALCLSGIAIALLLLVLFAMDLTLGVPFNKADTLLDIIFMVSSAGLAVISWLTLKDLR
jgi:hypothetical protein